MGAYPPKSETIDIQSSPPEEIQPQTLTYSNWHLLLKDLWLQILLLSDWQTIRNFSLSFKRAAEICRKEAIWKLLAARDFTSNWPQVSKLSSFVSYLARRYLILGDLIKSRNYIKDWNTEQSLFYYKGLLDPKHYQVLLTYLIRDPDPLMRKQQEIFEYYVEREVSRISAILMHSFYLRFSDQVDPITITIPLDQEKSFKYLCPQIPVKSVISVSTVYLINQYRLPENKLINIDYNPPCEGRNCVFFWRGRNYYCARVFQDYQYNPTLKWSQGLAKQEKVIIRLFYLEKD